VQRLITYDADNKKPGKALNKECESNGDHAEKNQEEAGEKTEEECEKEDRKGKRKLVTTEDTEKSNKREKTSVPTGNNEGILEYLKDEQWKNALKGEFSKEYFEGILTFMESELACGKEIFPPGNDIFSALNSTPIDKVKVVILGQDPYHDNNQANGLCFSVRDGIQHPPSLKNIFKELVTDIPGFKIPVSGSLEKWAQRGVLLLNATLTVEAHKANSHAKCGWMQFTDSIIEVLNKKTSGVVFILWGGFAQKKGKIIDRSKHFIIEAAHPSPLSVGKFWGCKVFSKTNNILKENGLEPINWML